MCNLLYHKWITSELENLANIQSPYYDEQVYNLIKEQQWVDALSYIETNLLPMSDSYAKGLYEVFHQMISEIVTLSE